MTKPSDLSPLFSDEDATPEEIARARRLVAYQELKESAAAYHRLMDDVDYKTPSESYKRRQDELIHNILVLVLELFPEGSKYK